MNTLEIKIILNIFNLIIILSSISINCDENLFIKENSISPSLNPPIRDNNINNIDQLLNKEDSIAVTYIKNEKEIPSYLLDDLSDFTPLITNENNNKTVINNELPFESINEVSYIFNKNIENKEICEYFPSILNNEFIKLNELKSNSFYIIEFFNSNNKKANYELNYLDDKTKKQITPYLFIKNILKDQLFYILEYSINNLPSFLQDFKYSEISNIENIKSKENYKVIKNCKLFFDRHFFIKILINHSIYLINLIPKLIFIEEIDFINKKYIKKINQWKCSIYDFNLFKDNNFNTININEDIKLEKKYEIKKNIFLKDNNKLLVRDFLNKNGRIYDKIPKKEIEKDEKLFYLEIIKIINILNKFNEHIIELQNIKLFSKNIKIFIKSINEIKNEFIPFKLINIGNYNFCLYENIYLSLYISIFGNLIKLSSSIIDIYNIYLKTD